MTYPKLTLLRPNQYLPNKDLFFVVKQFVNSHFESTNRCRPKPNFRVGSAWYGLKNKTLFTAIKLNYHIMSDIFGNGFSALF